MSIRPPSAMSFELISVEPKKKNVERPLIDSTVGDAMRVVRDHVLSHSSQFEVSFTFCVTVEKISNAYEVLLVSEFDVDDYLRVCSCVYRRFAEKFIMDCRVLFEKNPNILKSKEEGVDLFNWNGTYRFKTRSVDSSEILVNKWLYKLRENLRIAQPHILPSEEKPQIIFELKDGNSVKKMKTNDNRWSRPASDKYKKFDLCDQLQDVIDIKNSVSIKNCVRIEDFPNIQNQQQAFFSSLSDSE